MPVNSLDLVSSLDYDMLDSNHNEQRPSLPTSLSDFALIPTTSSGPPSPSSLTALDDGLNPFFRRLRRSSLLATNAITAAHDESKPNSPLVVSFTPPVRRSQLDAEKMAAETPSAAQSVLFTSAQASVSSDISETTSTSPPPSSASSFAHVDPPELPRRSSSSRLAPPLKTPRLLDLKTEISSPIESELKSEAQFQRVIASFSYNDFPPNKNIPRTPRSWSDRGRYPEEVGGDDEGGCDSASDEGEEANGANSVHSVSLTPSGSGEEQCMTIDTSVVGGFIMDIDMASAHSAISSPTHPQQWRQTPPPSGAVRPNKRKFEDRYDPYPTAAKRRAVSPSVNTLHHPHSHTHQSHSHSHTHSHTHSHRSSRSGSISHPHSSSSAIPIPVPRSTRSVTSSPVLRPASSPVMRPTSFPAQSPGLKGTSSPTMRPIARLPPLATLRGGSDGEREKSRRHVDGAEEAVGSLSLG